MAIIGIAVAVLAMLGVAGYLVLSPRKTAAYVPPPVVIPSTPTTRPDRTGGIVPPPTISVVELVARLKNTNSAEQLQAVNMLGDLGAKAQPAAGSLLEVAVGAPPSLQQAVASALDRIGPPASIEPTIIRSALAASEPRIRLYAARACATTPAPTNAVGVLVDALADKDPNMREAAVLALGRYGSDCRDHGAGPKLMERLLDDTPAVSAAAVTVLRRDEWRKEILPMEVVHLKRGTKSPESQVRATSGWLLAAAATSADEGIGMLRESLSDLDPEVRRVALLGLARWSKQLDSIGSDLQKLANDKQAAVRAVAVELVGDLPRSKEVIEVLMARSQSDEEPAVRNAALRALARQVTGRVEDLDKLRLLAGASDKTIRCQALEQIASLGADAKSATPEVISALAVPDSDVQLAALSAVAALPKMPDDAQALFQLASRIGKPISVSGGTGSGKPDPRVVAVGLLPQYGTTGIGYMVQLIEQPDAAVAVKQAACVTLGAAGPTARSQAVATLLLLADRTPEYRMSVADALIKIGGDETGLGLRKMTIWTTTKVTGKDSDTRRWALETLGKLDHATISKAEKESIRSTLIFAERTEPEAANRIVAMQSRQHYEPAKQK